MTNTTVTDRYSDYFSKYVNTDAARTTRRRATDAMDAIRNNPALNDYGKRIEIARIYRDTRYQLDQARADLHAAIRQETRDLTRQAFGTPDPTPAGIMAHRDARQRAAQLTSKEEALDAIGVAHLDGDLSLARAIAHHAHNNRWTDVVDAHRGEHPGVNEPLDILAEIPSGEGLAVIEGNIFGLPKPKELGSIDMTGDSLPYAEQIVAQADAQKA